MAAMDLVTFGEAMALFLAETATPVAMSPTFTRRTAGAEANVAVGLARLGHDAAWFGRVGDDDLGTAVLHDLRAEGVDVSAAVVDPARPTGIVVRDQIPGRATSVSYHRRGSAGGALEPADVPRHRIAGAAFLHVTGITPMLSDSAREATLAAVDSARSHDVAISFDPNIRLKLAPMTAWVAALQPFLDCALLLAGEQEARALCGGSDSEAIRSLHRSGARTVVIKLGADGAVVSSGGVAEHVEAFPTAETDPVGAGDSFAAGYLSAVLQGSTPRQAARRAAAVAALSVQGRGDWTAAPTAAECERFLGGNADVDR